MKIDDLPDVTATRIGWSQQLGIANLYYMYVVEICISHHLVLHVLRFFGIMQVRVLAYTLEKRS